MLISGSNICDHLFLLHHFFFTIQPPTTVSFRDHSSKIGRQSAKQNHREIIEMSDSSARAEQMDQTDKWSLDPSAVGPELQQQKPL